jgi:membrane associated rhomboid family serine protease
MRLGPDEPRAPQPPHGSPPPPPHGEDGVDLDAAGWVEPDAHEPPPLDLGAAVGDIRPWGAWALLAAWAAVFALMAARGELRDTAGLLAWGASVTGAPALESAWRLLASTFVHAGLAHLFFNALAMLVFGPAVERLLTRWGLAAVVALGGAAASAASLAWRVAHGSVYSLSVGASGAIYALGGALLAASWRLRHRLAPSRARALAAALLLLVVQGLVAGLEKSGTDNAAHAAGLAAGLSLGLALPLTPRLGGPRAPLAIRVLGAACALALATALALAVRGGLTGR